ncbi:MAG: GUN4 N-terminal ARM-like repeat domain-containing protein [Cyanobacteria bacterium J06623_5]
MTSTVINSDNLNSDNLSDRLNGLVATLATGSLRKQLQAIQTLSTLEAAGERALIDFLSAHLALQVSGQISGAETAESGLPTAAHGSAYQCLYRSLTEDAQSFVAEKLPHGLVIPRSEKGIDYGDLQTLLIQQAYQAADKLTMQKLCELAGERAVKRKWIYFTEVDQFPITDLRTIDMLWRIYSEDKFGWSKQHELWIRLGQDWERLWSQLIWKSPEGAWTRYPGEFIWDLSAPVGHLPLSNQLRGVRMIDALLSHPAWVQ